MLISGNKGFEFYRIYLILIAIGLYGPTHLAIAQPTAFFRIGQTSLAELDMKAYTADSSAEAVILADYGLSRLIKDDIRGYMTIYQRYTRIKILKKSAYDYANISVQFYRFGANQEEIIRDIQARTYNLKDGSIQYQEMGKSAIFEEKRSDKVYLSKFTLPNIHEGSVIEYSYTIESDLVSQLREWDFQREAPTVKSEYWLYLIPNFEYRILFQGIHKLTTNENQPQMDGISYHWGMANLPALRAEAYITTLDDYRAKVWFELVSTNLPSQGKRDYAKKWEDLDRTLLADGQFGGALNRSNFLKETAADLKNQTNDTLQSIKAANDWVKKNMRWNKRQTYWSENGLKDAFEKRTGSIADINLMLVALLREMGFNANPIILSTRSNGRFSKDYPLLSKFNAVVAHVAIRDKELLLDATDPIGKFGMLPFECLSGEGRLIGKQGKWISLKSTERKNHSITANINILPTGQYKGQITQYFSGYSGVEERRKIALTGIEKYKNDLIKSNPDMQISDFEIIHLDSTENALQIKLSLLIGEEHEVDRLYINPVIANRIASNPFKNTNRIFPIDFGIPMDESYVANLTIPTGFMVEELPKNIALSLQNGAAKFMYALQVTENVIQVSSRLSIRNTQFSPEDYHTLRELYDKIMAKHSELLVLKKTK